MDGTAPLHTFGSINKWNRKFVQDGSRIQHAPKYKNCVRPCLVEQDDDVLVLDAIPPPQLHLHIGGVNTAMDVMMDLWGETKVLEWCKKHHIMRRGYHGGSFDGNQFGPKGTPVFTYFKGPASFICYNASA